MPRVICRPGFWPWFATLFFGAMVTYLCFFLHPDNQPLPPFPPTDPERIGMIFVFFPPVLFCLMWCLIMRIEAASHGLSWHGLGGKRFVLWRDVLDYHYREVETGRGQHRWLNIVTTAGTIRIGDGMYTHADDLYLMLEDCVTDADFSRTL